MEIDSLQMINDVNVTSSRQCDDVQVNTLFFVITVALLSVCFLALVVSATLLLIVPKVNLLHANVKFLLQQSILGAVVASFSLLAKALYNVVVGIVGFERAQMSHFGCLLLSAPFSVSSQGFVSFLVAVGWERFWATMKRNDKDLKKPSWGVKALSVCLWSASILPNLHYILDNVAGLENQGSPHNFQTNSSTHQMVCYCDTIFVTGASVFGIVGYLLIFNVGSILIYWFVYKTNLSRYESFGINHARHNLQERFQTSNNMRATRMLLPFVISQAFVGTLVGGAYSWLIYCLTEGDLSNPPIRFVNVLSSLYILGALDYSLTPFLWIKYDECLKTAAFKRFPILRNMIGLRTTSTTKVVAFLPGLQLNPCDTFLMAKQDDFSPTSNFTETTSPPGFSQFKPPMTVICTQKRVGGSHDEEIGQFYDCSSGVAKNAINNQRQISVLPSNDQGDATKIGRNRKRQTRLQQNARHSAKEQGSGRLPD